MKKERLDSILQKRGIAKTGHDSFIIVTEGTIFVDGQKAVSPAQPVSQDAVIEVRGQDAYVGRAAYKLAAGLDAFAIDPSAKICADIGAATGGFTEVLIRRGARKIYAIDTARGKLALKIRQDPHVFVMEQTDVRDLASLPDAMDIAVMDVSLISLRDILLYVRRLLAPDADVIALFKPQYETRDPRILRRGVIKSAEDRERILEEFKHWLVAHEWRIVGQITSPITGSTGNTEYLFHIRQT